MYILKHESEKKTFPNMRVIKNILKHESEKKTFPNMRVIKKHSQTREWEKNILKHESEKKTFSNMKILLTKLGVVHQKIKFTSLHQELYTLHIAPVPTFSFSPLVEFC